MIKVEWLIEPDKFTYSPLGKALEKQTKTIENQGQKQIEALKVLKPDANQLTVTIVFPEYQLNEETKSE